MKHLGTLLRTQGKGSTHPLRSHDLAGPPALVWGGGPTLGGSLGARRRVGGHCGVGECPELHQDSGKVLGVFGLGLAMSAVAGLGASLWPGGIHCAGRGVYEWGIPGECLF